MNYDDVYELGTSIAHWGWSDEEVAKACCISNKPGDTSQLEFNKELAASSEGRLPPISELRLDRFALCCNHTVWFLKCLREGTPCDDPLVAVGGRLSLSHLETIDPLFARRAREGMQWTVLDWRVREHYPEICEMIIEAKNAGGTVNHRKSVFEVLSQIHAVSVKSAAANKGVPDWALVRQCVARTKPPCLPIVPELTAFVVSCSGGNAGLFLTELVSFSKNLGLGSLSRSIPGKFWQALGDSAHTDGDPMARLKCMCVLTNLTAEHSTIEDGVCHLLSAADMAIFAAQQGATQARVKRCNAMLNSGFELVHTVAKKCQEDEKEFALSSVLLVFACRVVRFMFSETKKRQRAGDSFTAVSGIGYELLVALRKVHPHADSLAGEVRLREWKPAKEEQSGKEEAAKASEQVTLTEMTADGRHADMASALRQHGLEIGGHLKHKTGDDDLWVLEGVLKNAKGEEVIDLKKLPGRDKSEQVDLATLRERFAKPPSGYENKLLHEDASWKERDPRSSKAAAVALVQADVVCALEVASRWHPDTHQAVQPMLNLRNQGAGIRAAKFAKVGSIIMVPWTDNVKVAFPGDEAMKSVGAFEVQYAEDSPLCKFEAAGKKPKIWLEPRPFQDKQAKANAEQETKRQDTPEKGGAALFWRVGTELKEKRDKINMGLGSIEVDTLGTITKQSSSLNAYRAKKPDFSLTARTSKMIIPVLVNTRDVQANEALKCEKRVKDKEQEDKALKRIATSGLLKRAAASSEEPPAKTAKH